MAIDQGPLYRLVYDSVVLMPFGEEGQQGIRDIVAVARERNRAMDITGVLYCDGAYFVQVLEGPREAVEAVMASILRDPRHTDLRIVESGPVPSRNFAGSSMSLVTEADIDRARARDPELLDLHAYRAAEVVVVMTRVLATLPTQEGVIQER